ncbi:MAG TPA: serine--tRNA ligase, partial [Campylobacterales bacterium]|nr:serine--tRNA ligase [Campylobacterales bacterium]
LDRELLNSLRELAFDSKEAKRKMEECLASQNEKSRLFGQYKKDGKDVNELKAELDKLKVEAAEYEARSKELEAKLYEFTLTFPNTPDESVPFGKDEDDNVLIKTVLEPKSLGFTPKDHVELGEALGWLDFERAVKISKSRFTVMRGEAARLERALINFMIDFNASRGFELVSVPFIVNADTMQGTGQLPKFEEDLFRLESDEERAFYLIPTAEVPLTNLYYDEIIPPENLPIKMTAHTPCFRKEAGSAGRDTRGMIRQHQFHKVELVVISKPEESMAMLDEMVSCASDMLRELGLPHRLMALCSGDMGFSAAKTVDIEVWIPSQDKYREISSVSNCGDFQARRAKIRYKDGKANKLVHTLNGSSLAVGRTLVAIMENYQRADGGIDIPQALKKYL